VSNFRSTVVPYIVTVNTGAGGTISLSKAFGREMIRPGAYAVLPNDVIGFTLTPDAGYAVKDITADPSDSPCRNTNAGAWSGGPIYTYVTGSITDDCSITPVFVHQ
jgi:hypothetical protein